MLFIMTKPVIADTYTTAHSEHTLINQNSIELARVYVNFNPEKLMNETTDGTQLGFNRDATLLYRHIHTSKARKYCSLV
jgi:hypothetical protein